MKNYESVDDQDPAPPPTTSWLDKKPVHIISTFISGGTFSGRMMDEKVLSVRTEVTAKWTKMRFPTSTTYNYGMEVIVRWS